MGMDVYGKKPDSEVGEYFRRNIWGWHPLWDYCTSVALVARTVKAGHYNDGDGLDKEDALVLASVLRAELESGRTKTTLSNREPSEQEQRHLDWWRQISRDVPGSKFVHVYKFGVDDVREFCEFLEHCGGFEIC
jgi:hypothetical protein